MKNSEFGLGPEALGLRNLACLQMSPPPSGKLESGEKTGTQLSSAIHRPPDPSRFFPEGGGDVCAQAIGIQLQESSHTFDKISGWE